MNGLRGGVSGLRPPKPLEMWIGFGEHLGCLATEKKLRSFPCLMRGLCVLHTAGDSDLDFLGPGIAQGMQLVSTLVYSLIHSAVCRNGPGTLPTKHAPPPAATDPSSNVSDSAVHTSK